MVCIIDDRDDVWNFAPNLIVVKPYKYFTGTDDVNDPFKENGNKDEEKTKEGAGDDGKDDKDVATISKEGDSTTSKETGEDDDKPSKSNDVKSNGSVAETEKNSKGNEQHGRYCMLYDGGWCQLGMSSIWKVCQFGF